MNFELYAAPTFGFTKPVKPHLSSNTPTTEQLTAYTAAKEHYELNIQPYNRAMEKHKALIAENMIKFKTDVINDIFDSQDQLKFPNIINRLYGIAWEQGHSNGLNEVYLSLQDLSDIITEVKKDLTK